MSVFAEFKSFAMRGNVIDLAVGVVIGAAFNSIINSLVADIVMPIFSIVTGNIKFTDLALTVGGQQLMYGKFLQASLSFIIIAFSLFLVIKLMNAIHKKEENKAPEVKAESDEVKVLNEIRDILKDKPA